MPVNYGFTPMHLHQLYLHQLYLRLKKHIQFLMIMTRKKKKLITFLMETMTRTQLFLIQR